MIDNIGDLPWYSADDVVFILYHEIPNGRRMSQGGGWEALEYMYPISREAAAGQDYPYQSESSES